MTGWQRAALGFPAYSPVFGGPVGPVVSQEQELALLRNQARCLEQALDQINARISEAESRAEGPKDDAAGKNP